MNGSLVYLRNFHMRTHVMQINSTFRTENNKDERGTEQRQMKHENELTIMNQNQNQIVTNIKIKYANHS